jgi:hypothetical protein
MPFFAEKPVFRIVSAIFFDNTLNTAIIVFLVLLNKSAPDETASAYKKKPDWAYPPGFCFLSLFLQRLLHAFLERLSCLETDGL